MAFLISNPEFILVYSIIGILIFLGIRCILMVAAGYGRTTIGSKYIKSVYKIKKDSESMWDSGTPAKLVSSVAGLVFISAEKKKQIANDLDRAGLNLTPEEFSARNYISLGFGIIGALICVLLKVYAAAAGLALVGILMWLKNRRLITSALESRDKAINTELPRFIRSICSSMGSDRDIVRIIKNYSLVAGKELKRELDILIVEMESGNIESALLHFENRLNNSYVSRLVTTLTNINKGVDQRATLEYLANDMTLLQTEMIKRELDKRPGKMKMIAIPVLIFSLGIVFFIFGYAIIQDMSGVMEVVD